MIIVQTPLRVSLLGGNTDLPDYYSKYGGKVLTTTIDKYIYCIIKRRFDDLIRVKYSIQESVENIDDLKHELVREALRMLGITKGIEINFLSDIPTVGTGLGSSSSVTVGVLNALHSYIGETVSSEQLAEEAVRIEIDILHKPIGIQDQYIAAFGGLRLLEFPQMGKVKSERIDISESVREDFDGSLMLFYTGITRQTNEILATLDIDSHLELLHRNKELVDLGVNALRNGKIREFGGLLDEYWKAKRSLSSSISNKAIDDMYDKARKCGALGGKITGAGGGGFMLLMVPENKRNIVREGLKEYKELPFRLEMDGSKVIFNIRRY